MDSKIDWEALGAVYSSPQPTPRQLTNLDITSRPQGIETELELAEERAAIIEYDGGLSRNEAEANAIQISGNRS